MKQISNKLGTRLIHTQDRNKAYCDIITTVEHLVMNRVVHKVSHREHVKSEIKNKLKEERG